MTPPAGWLRKVTDRVAATPKRASLEKGQDSGSAIRMALDR